MGIKMSGVVEQVEPETAAMLRRVFHGIAEKCRTHQEDEAKFAAERWRLEMQSLQRPGLADVFGDIVQCIDTAQPRQARRQALSLVVAMSRQSQGRRWRLECGPGV